MPDNVEYTSSPNSVEHTEEEEVDQLYTASRRNTTYDAGTRRNTIYNAGGQRRNTVYPRADEEIGVEGDGEKEEGEGERTGERNEMTPLGGPNATSRAVSSFGQYDADNEIPAPGYSGHLQAMSQVGVGKPFTVAAKESRRLQHSYQESVANGGSSGAGSREASNEQMVEVGGYVRYEGGGTGERPPRPVAQQQQQTQPSQQEQRQQPVPFPTAKPRRQTAPAVGLQLHQHSLPY